MHLNLANWSERQTYFLGRFYDLATQLFLKTALHPGETCIDIGANIGMMTLLAARQVGPRGQVLAFEPNPECGDRIQKVLDENKIGQVKLYNLGLSDAPAVLELRVLRNHTGFGTFADIPSELKDVVTDTYKIDVRRGDDTLPPSLTGPVTIKIDVEGFEGHALRGLSKTIQTYKPAVVMELVESHLNRAGSSGAALFQMFQDWGYEGYALRIKRGGFRYGLTLRRALTPSAVDANGVVWLDPQGPHIERFKNVIVAEANKMTNPNL